MTGLAFRCSYTRHKDVAGTSPCGRRAARRRRGESRCFDHWVVDWVGAGDTRGGRWVYGTVFAFIFVMMVSQLVDTVSGGVREPLVIQLTMLGLACWSGSSFVAKVWEHPLGGRLWFVSSPFLSVALTLSAATIWFGDGRSVLLGSMGDSRLGRALVALYALVLAIIVVIEWGRFLMHVRERDLGSGYLRLLGHVLMGVVLLIVVALAVASRGTESDRLVYPALALGALGLVRSARRITEFVRRLRI
ncbi:hypothetical protein WEI85_47385 [Actinomycetes bacterium KLBMP 9797]